ncbi:MAG: AAA family ATPase [Caulobacteraceae bacterium]
MNRYWDAAGQPEDALALLPLFMALRAAVRTAVAMEAGDAAEADGYRRLGLDLLAPATPRLVAIGGLSGSGKSAVAREIAADLPGVCGARLLRTDVIRKQALGAAATDALDAAAYSDDARAAVYRELAARAAAALAAGASVVADATFQDSAARTEVEAAAGAAPFAAVWLRASLEVRVAPRLAPHRRPFRRRRPGRRRAGRAGPAARLARHRRRWDAAGGGRAGARGSRPAAVFPGHPREGGDPSSLTPGPSTVRHHGSPLSRGRTEQRNA